MKRTGKGRKSHAGKWLLSLLLVLAMGLTTLLPGIAQEAGEDAALEETEQISEADPDVEAEAAEENEAGEAAAAEDDDEKAAAEEDLDEPKEFAEESAPEDSFDEDALEETLPEEEDWDLSEEISEDLAAIEDTGDTDEVWIIDEVEEAVTLLGDEAPEEEVTLRVKVVWPVAAGDQPLPAQVDVALYQENVYNATIAANGFSGDMYDYYPYEMPGYLKKITLSAATEWAGAVTLKRSELSGISDQQTIADYVTENLVWKEERPLGYVLSGSTVSEDGLLTTISNTVQTATTSRTLRIEWDDQDNKEGVRPSSVAATLNSGASVTLSADNSWTGTVSGLPYYVDGTRYSYDWYEPDVQNYALSEVSISETETVFTFTCLVSTTSVEKEVELKTAKLTIKYVDGNGNKLFDNFVGLYAVGDSYNVKSPSKAGYIPDKNRVKGTLKKKTTITVKYTPQEYTLTVRYLGTDGSTVAKEHTEKVTTGSEYEVDSPQVNGYTAQKESVSGTMPGKDTEMVVYYAPVSSASSSSSASSAQPTSTTASSSSSSDTQPAQTEAQTETQTEKTEETESGNLEDYATPLGVGMVSINAGDCLE